MGKIDPCRCWKRTPTGARCVTSELRVFRFGCERLNDVCNGAHYAHVRNESLHTEEDFLHQTGVPLDGRRSTREQRTVQSSVRSFRVE